MHAATDSTRYIVTPKGQDVFRHFEAAERERQEIYRACGAVIDIDGRVLGSTSPNAALIVSLDLMRDVLHLVRAEPDHITAHPTLVTTGPESIVVH